MSRLATEVAGLFAGLDGYERYADALVVADVDRRARAVERTRLWRLMNPAKYKALRKRCKRNWMKRRPDRYYAQKKRARERKLEHWRARDRKNKRAKRTRRKG